MDIINFINSKDIRNHLHNIVYKLRTDEAAFIVYYSRRPFEEKIEAWNWIADNMPNTSRIAHRQTIHNFRYVLREFIKLQQAKITRFKENPNNEYVYTFSYFSIDEREEGQYYYTSFDSLVEAILRYNNDEDTTDKMRRLEVCKCKLNDDEYGPCDKVKLTDAGKISDIYINSKHHPDIYNGNVQDDMDLFDVDIMFEMMFFNIPTPFERGDILINRYDFHSDLPPVVLDSMINWDEKKLEEHHQKWYRHDEWLSRAESSNDYTDMNAYVYSYSDKYGIHDADLVPDFYLDYERYDGELKDGYRCLKALSALMKHEINEEMYSFAISRIRDEEKITQACCRWSKEALEKVGLPVTKELCWEKLEE